MNLNEYQEQAKKTADFPEMLKPNNYIYVALGLAGESGEVVEKIKKVVRNKEGKIDQEFKDDIKKELGDVMWYIAIMADELGITLEEVAQANVDKLASRYKRGVIKSEGDNR